jgi:hypothetical protein
MGAGEDVVKKGRKHLDMKKCRKKEEGRSYKEMNES